MRIPQSRIADARETAEGVDATGRRVTVVQLRRGALVEIWRIEGGSVLSNCHYYRLMESESVFTFITCACVLRRTNYSITSDKRGNIKGIIIVLVSIARRLIAPCIICANISVISSDPTWLRVTHRIILIVESILIVDCNQRLSPTLQVRYGSGRAVDVQSAVSNIVIPSMNNA